MHTSSYLHNSCTIQNPLLIYDFINDKYATKICTITVTCMKYVHFSVNSNFIIIVHVLHAEQFHLIATMVVFRSVYAPKKYLLPCMGVAKIDKSLQIPHCTPCTAGLNLSTPYCDNCHHVTSSVYYLGLKWRVRIASGLMQI